MQNKHEEIHAHTIITKLMKTKGKKRKKNPKSSWKKRAHNVVGSKNSNECGNNVVR